MRAPKLLLSGKTGASSLSVASTKLVPTSSSRWPASLPVASRTSPFGGGDGAELFPYVQYGYGVALQEDGKIVVVAPDFVSPGNINWTIARFDPAGLPDASFGSGDGIAITDFGLEAASPAEVAVQPDGNIVVTGSKTVMGDTYRIVVADTRPIETLTRGSASPG
jgi:hypothetical protein